MYDSNKIVELVNSLVSEGRKGFMPEYQASRSKSDCLAVALSEAENFLDIDCLLTAYNWFEGQNQVDYVGLLELIQDNPNIYLDQLIGAVKLLKSGRTFEVKQNSGEKIKVKLTVKVEIEGL